MNELGKTTKYLRMAGVLAEILGDALLRTGQQRTQNKRTNNGITISVREILRF
jgi:hypothetical protein